MIRFLDSLVVPNDAQLHAAWDADRHGWAGYIGGPSAAGIWPREAYTRVVKAGLTTAGFWVGLGDVQALRSVLDAYSGFIPKGSVIGHDVETNQDVHNLTDSYADQWASSVRRSGYRPALYGLPDTTNRFGRHYDSVWFAGGAYYRTGKIPPPSDPRESGYPQVSRVRAWQWWGTHDFNGIGVDESVCDDWFAGVEMDWNTIVKSWYYLAFRRNPAQSEIDGWVSRLVAGENGEQILDEFFAGPEGQAFLHPASTDAVALAGEVAQIKRGLAQASQ